MITDVVEESMKTEQPKAEELPFFVVREYPNEGLKTKCAPFLESFARIQSLVDILEKTMVAHQAAGLAGTQVGVFFRILCIRRNGQPLTMVNPQLTEVGNVKAKELEGCLSFPGLFLKVSRPVAAKVKYKNRKGVEVEEWFYGIEARAVQHEIDHLDGLTFLDRIPAFERQGAMQKMKIAQRRGRAQQRHVEEFLAQLTAQSAKENAVKAGPSWTKEQPQKSADVTLDFGTPMPMPPVDAEHFEPLVLGRATVTETAPSVGTTETPEP